MTKDEIKALDSTRHVKMWLLHKHHGMDRKAIAEFLGGTNPGAVGNELRKYESDTERQKLAERIGAGEKIEAPKGSFAERMKAAKEAKKKDLKATEPAPASNADADKKNIDALVGKRYEIWLPGAHEPSIAKIDSVEIDAPKYSKRSVHLKQSAGTEDVIKLADASDFIAGKDISLRDSKGEKYVISLIISAGDGTKTAGASGGGSEGGLLVGVKHTPEGAGIEVQTPEGKLKAEGGEVIINAAAAKENCEELSRINQSAGNGVAFDCNHPALDGKQGPMAGDGTRVSELEEKLIRAQDHYYRIVRADGNNKSAGARAAWQTVTSIKEDIKKARMAGDGAKVAKLHDAVLYNGEVGHVSEKDGIIGISQKGTGRFAREWAFTPLGKIHQEAELTDMTGKPIFVPYSFAGNGASVSECACAHDKPYYLLTKEETISERDRLEKMMKYEVGKSPEGERMRELRRHSIVKFHTPLSELK